MAGAVCSTRPEDVAAATPVLSLGARVPGGVLRLARRPAGRRRLRRRHRQSAVGHDPRRRGPADERVARAARDERRRPVHARRRRLCRAVGRPREPLPAVPRARASPDAPRRTHRAGPAVGLSRPTTAAPRCGGCCSRSATSTPSSGSTTAAASSRFTGASGSCCSPRRAAGRRGTIACRLGERNPGRARIGRIRRTTTRWFPVRVTPALLERLTGPDLALPELDIADRPDDRRARRRAVPSARRRDRVGGALRPRAERHRRPRGIFRPPAAACRSSRASSSSRFASTSPASRWSIAPTTRERAARRRGIAACAARLPRRRERDEPPRRSSRRCCRRGRARRTRCSACERRFRAPPSTSSAACSTASSSTIWCGCASTTHVTTAIVERLPIPMLDDVPDCDGDRAASARRCVRLKADATQRTTHAARRLNALVADLYQTERATSSRTCSARSRSCSASIATRRSTHRDAALREFQKRRV